MKKVMAIIFAFVTFGLSLVVGYLLIALSYCVVIYGSAPHAFQRFSDKWIIYCQDATQPELVVEIILPIVGVYLAYKVYKRIYNGKKQNDNYPNTADGSNDSR